MARYLRLFEDNGAFIPRHGLMLIAATTNPDPGEIEICYAMMCAHDDVADKLKQDTWTLAARKIEKHVIRRDHSDRVLAGEVVLELVAHAAIRKTPPSVKDGLRQVARFGGIPQNQKVQEREPGTADFTNALARAREAFMKYRSISHYLASLVYEPSNFVKLEDEPDTFSRSAGLARGFEIFLDNNVFYGQAEWDPIRVPTCIEPVTDLSFSPAILER